MKIDLHCHTLNCKSGDGSKREPTVDLFREKVELAEVKILAITNHNYFDLEQYKLLKNAVSDICDVWPGIELDVKESSQNIGHVLVIVNPSKLDEFYSIVMENINKSNPEKFIITVSKMCELFNSLEVIYIPHYFKEHQLGESDLQILEDKVYSIKRILCEPSDVKSLGVLNANGFRSIVGSDVKDWNVYEKCSFAELKYEINGYENFLKLLDKDTTFINDLITQDYYETITVYGKASKNQYPYEIKIYNDVNIIFGDKGSGKTEILDSLYSYFKTNKGINPVRFNGGDKSSWFDNLIKESKEYTYDDLGVENIDCVFSHINDYVDALPVKIGQYIRYFHNISNNKKRKKLRILNQQKLFTYELEIYQKYYEDYKKIAGFINDLIEFEVYKMNVLKYEDIIDELISLKNDAFDLCLSEWMNQKATYLTDNIIEKLITFVSESDGTPEEPKETGFYRFCKNRLKLKKDIHDLLNTLNSDTITLDEEYIGRIGSKGKGYVINRLGIVNLDNIDTINSKKMFSNKTPLKNLLKSINKLELSLFTEEMNENLNAVNEIMSSYQIGSINNFLYNNKTFELNNEVYKPSKGEMAILSLQYELLNKDTENVFLIDELEVNLGSTYIEDTIVPLIKSLAKSKKIIVIATHDANIATRTFPVNSILKIVNNDCYETYQGSMFTNQLVNIDNNKKILYWNEESEKYLEGGKPAFIERGNLYGK